jgi:hypothetical protein
MPSPIMSSRASRLLVHHQSRGRTFPTQRYWDRLYQMLEEEAEKRGKTPPPPPLSPSHDPSASEEDKIQRLSEQVAWADRNKLLHRVQMFFDAIPPSGWSLQDGR